MRVQTRKMILQKLAPSRPRFATISRSTISTFGNSCDHLITRFFSALIVTVFMLPAASRAQTFEQSATYTSQLDKSLTIRKVAVLPATDNVDGIYARPLTAELVEFVKQSHRWDYQELQKLPELKTNQESLSELEESPTAVRKLKSGVPVDALIGAHATRGPNGLSVRLDLFLMQDGELLAQEVLRDHPKFQLADFKEQVHQLYGRLIGKIPYQGLILSREQNRVTINLGQSDRIHVGQMLTAVQILNIQRHPKFHFIISSEKEIIGRIKISKVEDTLSFGIIQSEKEKGAVQKLAKIAGVEPLTYAVNDADLPPGAIAPDAGAGAHEWVPTKPATFGQVGIRLGIGQYASNSNLVTAGPLEGKANFYPSIGVNGELWLNPEWTVRAEILQGIISLSNPYPGSKPGTLSLSQGRYLLSVDYNFLLQDDFFGPKFFVNSGFVLTRVSVDDSTPRALTSTSYSGFLLGLGGKFPVTENKSWYLGGSFNLLLFPRLSESPVSSGGAPKNTINEFRLFSENKMAENIFLVSTLEYSQYMTSFSGGGTRSDGDYATTSSQRQTVLSVGINYQF